MRRESGRSRGFHVLKPASFQSRVALPPTANRQPPGNPLATAAPD